MRLKVSPKTAIQKIDALVREGAEMVSWYCETYEQVEQDAEIEQEEIREAREREKVAQRSLPDNVPLKLENGKEVMIPNLAKFVSFPRIEIPSVTDYFPEETEAAKVGMQKLRQRFHDWRDKTEAELTAIYMDFTPMYAFRNSYGEYYSAPIGIGGADEGFAEVCVAKYCIGQVKCGRMIETKNKVLLWDFDGTLAHREGMWRGCLIAILQRVCPESTVTTEEIRPYMNHGFPWHEPEREHAHIHTADDWWQELLMPVLINAYTSVGVDSKLAEKCANEVRKEFTDPRKWKVFDDTEPVLKRLKEEGWSHFIVSNHVPELRELVINLGLSPLMSAVFSSATTGYEKPNPKMFEYVLDHVGDCTDVWMIGDNINADIAGAKAVGIKGILVRNADDSAEHFCGDLEGIFSIIEA